MDVGQLKAAEHQAARDQQGRGLGNAATGPGVLGQGDGANGTDLARALVAEAAGVEITSPNELRLKVDRDLDQIVATVVDTKSDRVLRTIPPEELLEAAKRLQAALGQILNHEV